MSVNFTSDISDICVEMLDKLSGINAIDLMCDDSMQEFYERFGMKKLNGMGLRR